MSSVQVALAFAVELISFHNIDLFHQGAYQIRSYLKNNSSSPVIIEPPKVWDRLKNESFPECVGNSFVSPADLKTNTPVKAVSKTILIIYKEETLRMHDVFEQTMHFQIDALLIEELIYKSDIELTVELWFGEKKNDSFEEMKVVCERTLKIHFIPSQGLHHHITVMFDYYYLAAVEMVVHASLISISPCYLKLPQSIANNSANNFDKNVSFYQSWHSILFNTGKNCGRRHTACLIHTHLCGLLISVIESLFSTFQEALSFLSPDERSKIDEKLRSQLCPFQSNSSNWMKFTPNELERLVTILQSLTSEDDMSDQASIDITKLSSRIVVLFNEYLKNVSYNIAYVDSLTMHTHKLRIKRFSEAFFFQERSIVELLAVYDPNTNGHESIVAKVRESTYYRQLPPLPVECPDTDGESYDQPIMIEEIFIPETRRCNNPETKSLSSSSSGSDFDTKTKNDKDINIYKKRRNGTMYEKNMAIPVLRKINPSYNRKDLPIQEEKVSLVGYRSLGNKAFNNSTRKTISNNDVSDSSELVSFTSMSRQGFGTLKLSNDFLQNIGERNDNWRTSRVKMMSRSMPDLSHMDNKVRLRKNHIKNRKNQIRFSSIYEVEESKSWLCTSNSLCNSHRNLVLTYPSDYNCVERTLLADHVNNSDDKLTILEMLSDPQLERPQSALILSQDDSSISSLSFNNYKCLSKSSTQLSSISHSSQEDNIKILTFNQLKINLMEGLKPHFRGNVYSDLLEFPASKRPYFSLRESDDLSLCSDLHYVICVHGLDGEHRDLRLVKTYLSLALPEQRFEFLMSESNEQDNFTDIRIMKERLVDEIIEKIDELKEKPKKISFIGHSLGCVLIRAAISSPRMTSLIPRFYTFLSLGGPHLGTVYGSSMLVNVGLWVMQKVRKSICLQQLSMKDSIVDLRQSYIYDLSGQPGLEYFKFVLLASSPQDRYVPYHSTRIELCRASVRDNSEMGIVYMEMVTKLLQRLLQSGKTTVVRYDAHYTLPRSANNYIGRAAHIALIDSELFLEKFISVSAAKYFR